MSCHHLLPVHGQNLILQPPAGIPLCSHSNLVCQHLELEGLMSSGSSHRFIARQASRIKQQLALSDSSIHVSYKGTSYKHKRGQCSSRSYLATKIFPSCSAVSASGGGWQLHFLISFCPHSCRAFPALCPCCSPGVVLPSCWTGTGSTQGVTHGCISLPKTPQQVGVRVTLRRAC